MRPSVKQLIAGIRWSFKTYAVPDLSSRLGQSTGRSIMVLLDHLHERVEVEGQLLMDDNEDMRSLFETLSNFLSPLFEQGAGTEIQAALGRMREKAEKQFRAVGSSPGVDSLTEENEELKRTVVDVFRVLQQHKGSVPEEMYLKAERAMRDQMRRQLDREHQWIEPVMGKRPY